MNENYDVVIQEKAERVFSVMADRVSAQDVARIREAYEFARVAQAGQKRKSGEPYLIHPTAVALIVAEELMLGANPVIAAFLHDVVEDTELSVDYQGQADKVYPVSIQIQAVDRYHLLSYIINCITTELSLSIDVLKTNTVDCIVDCSIDFGVHSYNELQIAISHISAINCVEEVKKL